MMINKNYIDKKFVCEIIFELFYLSSKRKTVFQFRVVTFWPDNFSSVGPGAPQREPITRVMLKASSATI